MGSTLPKKEEIKNQDTQLMMIMITSNKSIDDHDQDTQLMMIMSTKSTDDDHDHVK